MTENLNKKLNELMESSEKLKKIIDENFGSHVKTIINDDMEVLKLSHQRIRLQEKIKQQLEKVEFEKQQLKIELVKAEQKLEARTDQLNQSNILIEKEKIRTSRIVQNRDFYQKHLDDLLYTLPENIKREIIKKLPPIEKNKELTSSSEIEITDSNFSSVITSSENDSDDWHLFPDLNGHGQKLRKNKLFPPKTSSIGEDYVKYPNYEKIQFSDKKAVRQSILDESIDIDGYYTSLRSTLPLNSLNSDNSLYFYTGIMEQLMNRPHNFVRHNFVLGEKCLVCYSRIACGKSALRCMDCNAVVHIECRETIPKPCIPMKPIKSKSCSINDHCTYFAPFIPAVVIHCVMQIEARGLQTPGLYRIPNFNKTFRSLSEELRRNRGVPNLLQVDVSFIYEFLKDFLSSLKPALISANFFHDLMKTFENVSSENITYDMVCDIFSSLPPCNRDTFTFLIIHLRNVAKSEACRMSARSLSKIFTPILVENYKSGVYKEEKEKCIFFERLIRIPSEYWKCIMIKNL
ncbi:hypothetical protein PGB90_001421 [Kerria lacca]